MDLTHKVVINLLTQLNNLKIINYIPKNKDTLITFLEPRQDVKKITISKTAYSQRKSNDLNKIKAVIEYAYNKEKCRNKMLLSYFGEKFDQKQCYCDICITKNKVSEDPKKIATLIRSKLSKKPLEINDIIGKKKSPEQQSQFTAIIKKMLDNNELILNDMNQLQLKKK